MEIKLVILTYITFTNLKQKECRDEPHFNFWEQVMTQALQTTGKRHSIFRELKMIHIMFSIK